MNARHHLWRKEVDNQIGQTFGSLLIEEKIILLNKRKPTQYHMLTDSCATIVLPIIVSSDFYSASITNLYPAFVKVITTPF